MAKNVTNRTAKASMALLGARIFVKVIDLALQLILARILLPEDFGLVAMALIFIQVTESCLELPVIQAIIQAPKITNRMLDTAFTISVIRALILTAIIAAFAPIAMQLFSEPRLGLLMIVLALSPALRGLVNPKLVMFARELNYVPEATIDVIAKVVTTAIAVPFALYTQSYWSLAIMTVITPVFMIVGSYIVAPYRPRLTLKDWPQFSNMISWQSLSQLFIAANWQVDMFILSSSSSYAANGSPKGEVGAASDTSSAHALNETGASPDAGKTVVGQYSIAQQLAGAPFQVFVIPIMRPFIAAFSELRTPEAIRPGYLTATSAVFTAMGPILALTVLMAGPLVALAFDENWTGAALFLSVLAFSQLIQLPSQPVSSVVLAMNKARFNAVQAAIGLAVKAPLLYFGLKLYGAEGFLAGQIIGVTAWMIAGMFIVKHVIQLPVVSQIIALIRPTLGLIAMAAVLYPLMQLSNKHYPSLLDGSNPLLLALTVGILCGIGMVVYWGIVMALWYMAGKPNGAERMVDGVIAKVTKRPPPKKEAA